MGSLFRPFQHLRLAGDERGIFLIPSPLTQAIGFGPLYLPREEIELRSIRKAGFDLVELAPTDTSCGTVWLSARAWRKSGLAA